ncbi:MAG TPA: NADH-quinone oxidoreductase subunit N [Candidatus Omnitrophota bacterium]|nr:NADH-quinone oxidoreductase subunit N [Candidatus Omnitrophota bacterium]
MADAFLFLPEITTLVLAAVLFLMTLTDESKLEERLKPFMVVSSLLVLGASTWALRASGDLFTSTYRIDLLSQGFKWLLSLSFFITVLFTREAVSIPSKRKLEYFFFLFTALLGMMMIASSVDILVLFLSLELSAYSLYLLSAIRKDPRTAESSLKYLLFGAVATGIFLWGVSLLVGLSGSTSLMVIAEKAPELMTSPAFVLGLIFASFTFLFKLSGAPLHFWAPDVYETSATPVTSFIATASKAAAVAVLIRFFMFTGLSSGIITLLGILAFVSMTLGNCVALVQQDVKRLLAYSSIAQAGYLILGLLAGSFEGYSSSFFYAFAYIIMNTGAFFVVLFVAKSIKHDNPQISHFDGLADRSPFLALILLLSLLSLAGIPPLIGFTGKWILFSAAMDKGHWFLVLWGVLNSVVSLFYYLTLVKHAYLEKPKDPQPIAIPVHFKVMGLLLFFVLVVVGIFPTYFVTFARDAVSAAGIF